MFMQVDYPMMKKLKNGGKYAQLDIFQLYSPRILGFITKYLFLKRDIVTN